MTENKPHVLSTNNDVFDLRYHLLNIKTITDNTKEVTSLLVLLDKRIASSSMVVMKINYNNKSMLYLKEKEMSSFVYSKHQHVQN